MRYPCLFFLCPVVEVRCACLCAHPTCVSSHLAQALANQNMSQPASITSVIQRIDTFTHAKLESASEQRLVAAAVVEVALARARAKAVNVGNVEAGQRVCCSALHEQIRQLERIIVALRDRMQFQGLAGCCTTSAFACKKFVCAVQGYPSFDPESCQKESDWEGGSTDALLTSGTGATSRCFLRTWHSSGDRVTKSQCCLCACVWCVLCLCAMSLCDVTTSLKVLLFFSKFISFPRVFHFCFCTNSFEQRFHPKLVV